MKKNSTGMQCRTRHTLVTDFGHASSKRGRSAMYRLLLGAILCVSASAQTNPLLGRLSLGVVGGVPITGGLFSENTRYTVGPSAEFRLSNHFALNFSPQYKRSYSDSGFIYPLEQLTNAVDFPRTLTIQDFEQVRDNVWEFPLMLKYYFDSPQHALRPFIETGYNVSTSWRTYRSELRDPGYRHFGAHTPKLCYALFRSSVCRSIIWSRSIDPTPLDRRVAPNSLYPLGLQHFRAPPRPTGFLTANSLLKKLLSPARVR